MRKREVLDLCWEQVDLNEGLLAAEAGFEPAPVGDEPAARQDAPETRFSSSKPGRPERSGTTTISIRRFAAFASGESLGLVGLLSP
jgi:hypothetical protein